MTHSTWLFVTFQQEEQIYVGRWRKQGMDLCIYCKNTKVTSRTKDVAAHQWINQFVSQLWTRTDQTPRQTPPPEPPAKTRNELGKNLKLSRRGLHLSEVTCIKRWCGGLWGTLQIRQQKASIDSIWDTQRINRVYYFLTFLHRRFGRMVWHEEGRDAGQGAHSLQAP